MLTYVKIYSGILVGVNFRHIKIQTNGRRKIRQAAIVSALITNVSANIP